jgi:hypothetical protein
VTHHSQAGARDLGHQVGCPTMHNAKVPCSCAPGGRGSYYLPGDINNEDIHYPTLWMALGAVAISATVLILWVLGVIPGGHE